MGTASGGLEGKVPQKRSEQEVRSTKQQKQKKLGIAAQQLPPEPPEGLLGRVDSGEVVSLKDQLRQEQERSKENLNKLLYIQADFENYRKRLDQEVESRVYSGKARLVQNLLAIVDEWEDAMKAAKDTQDPSAVAEGLEIVLKKLRAILTAEGLSKIDAIGKKFDPTLHEAVGRVPCDDREEGTVLEEVREGFTMKGRLVRPSIVKIAVPPIAEPVNSEPVKSGES